MYTLEDLVTELKESTGKGDFNAVQEAVRHVIAEKPFAADPGKTQILHDEPGLTIVHVAVNAGFGSPPHDHRTWAVIGVYDGQEDNTFYRLVDNTRAIEQAGGKSLQERDVLMLGQNGIHKIANPRGETLVALHVYGKNIFTIERSAWDPVTGLERPFDMKVDSRGGIRR
jgi:predicted metal-dependent enzyme (double-stranded beta helix superfamily)